MYSYDQAQMASWVAVVMWAGSSARTRLVLQCRVRKAGSTAVRLHLIGRRLRRAALVRIWGSSLRAAGHRTGRSNPGPRRCSRCWRTAMARLCFCASCRRWAAHRCWSSGSLAVASRSFPRTPHSGGSSWPEPCTAATCVRAWCPAGSQRRPGAAYGSAFSSCSWTQACLSRCMRRCRRCYGTVCSRSSSGLTSIWNTLTLLNRHQGHGYQDTRPRLHRGRSLRKRPSFPTMQPIRSVQLIRSAGKVQCSFWVRCGWYVSEMWVRWSEMEWDVGEMEWEAGEMRARWSEKRVRWSEKRVRCGWDVGEMERDVGEMRVRWREMWVRWSEMEWDAGEMEWEAGEMWVRWSEVWVRWSEMSEKRVRCGWDGVRSGWDWVRCVWDGVRCGWDGVRSG